LPIEPERRRFSLRRLVPSFGAEAGDIAGDLLMRIEERLIWARFGL
jgi:hypothetical protein